MPDRQNTNLSRARRDAGQEAAGSNLVVEKRVQLAIYLALGELTLNVVRLGHFL